MSPPKNVDLMVLAAALAVFVVAGWPILGFAVAAAAWLAQRGIQVLAGRRLTVEEARAYALVALAFTHQMPRLRREALCCIPGAAGRNSKGGSWV